MASTNPIITAPCGRTIHTITAQRIGAAEIIARLDEHEAECADCQAGTTRPTVSLVKGAARLVQRPFCPDCGQSGHGVHGTAPTAHR